MRGLGLQRTHRDLAKDTPMLIPSFSFPGISSIMTASWEAENALKGRENWSHILGIKTVTPSVFSICCVQDPGTVG